MVPPTPSPTMEPNATAGRGRSPRSERTRTSVVDALLDLLRDGNLRPTAKEIAERAGTSLRSVYVHFDDLEDLFTAAAGRAIGRIAGLMEAIPSTGPFEARLDAFVSQRARVYEALGEVRHAAALQEPFSPGLAQLLSHGRRRARHEFESVFAPELEALPAGERAAVTAACDALASAATWDHWRHQQDHDVDAACAALRLGLHRILVAS
ncbi:MAG TPA: TetR/AcrR family transcriptional regulator [Acidimicrobiia bacterium]